jgi:hypothetical protein
MKANVGAASLLLLTGLTLTGCGYSTGSRALSGGAIGAGTGAIIGAATGLGPGLGAAIGGQLTAWRRGRAERWVNESSPWRFAGGTG